MANGDEMKQTNMLEGLPQGSSGSEEADLRSFLEDPFACIDVLSKKHGTLFALRLGTLGTEPVKNVTSNGYWVFLTRPQQLRLMYEADASHASGALANKLAFGTDDASVSYLEGKAHKLRRAQLHPAFNGRRDYTSLILEVADKCIAEWPREKPFLLFRELQKLSSNLITEIMCGCMEEKDRAQLASMLPKTEDVGCPRHEAKAAEMSIRGLVFERINGYLQRAQAHGRSDVSTTLLELAEAGDESLTPEVIRDEVFGLLYTGFSTTSSTLSWAILRILSNPTVYQQLMQEVQEVVAAGPLSRKILNGLPYLDATIKETLRLHPVTALNGLRLLLRPMAIERYLLPAGTMLVHCAYLLQRSSDVYPDPERFFPERFLNQRIDPYAWGPFGGGERVCIGRGLSLDEMKVLLVKMLSELHIEMVGDLPPAQLQGFFMAPKNGAPCILRE